VARDLGERQRAAAGDHEAGWVCQDARDDARRHVQQRLRLVQRNLLQQRQGARRVGMQHGPQTLHSRAEQSDALEKVQARDQLAHPAIGHVRDQSVEIGMFQTGIRKRHEISESSRTTRTREGQMLVRPQS
jgi:hypothetical protein